MTKKGRLCIVMEYADGGDVHDEIKKMERMCIPRAHRMVFIACVHPCSTACVIEPRM